jgi:hypothetical protein
MKIATRPAHEVMRLSRMGSSHACRLSFMRTLLRRMKRDNWQFSRPVWQIDDNGVGHAVYQMQGPERCYSLVAFAHDLPANLRSDRVIAEAWDATFTLHDGIPSADDIERLAANVPYQEAGRISAKEIVLARANRSARLFNYVAESLAGGHQPDHAELTKTGYLMRTSAVYGSGKFGAMDHTQVKDRPEFAAPFQAEMLSVWLIRAFTIDLVEHMARAKGGDNACPLDNEGRRMLGVGNSTGLGMAPFLINHPALLNQWVVTRETALTRVRSLEHSHANTYKAFIACIAQARDNARHWHSNHPLQIKKIGALNRDLSEFSAYLEGFDFPSPYPWNRLFNWARENLSVEGQEQVFMLILEPHGELIDDLTDQLSVDEDGLLPLDTEMTVQAMVDRLEQYYAWALTADYNQSHEKQRFWYVSEEKLEPRLGERFEEEGVEYEVPLCIAWHVAQLHKALVKFEGSARLSAFLTQHPEHRQILRRSQQITRWPYMEIQDNLIAGDMMPIDMLRFKLAFFGAAKFDPRSDRWVRINMFQDAPYPDQLDSASTDIWGYANHTD